MPRAPSFRALDWACVCIAAGLAIRVWWWNAAESLNLDETLTAFVTRYGSDHASLDIAPGARQTLYYPLLRVMRDWFGLSELLLRLPSLLMSLATLAMVWRLAAWLIHRDAAWIAVFLFFVPRSFAMHATNARPYAMAMLATTVAAWLLIRYLDDPRRKVSGVGFCLCAVLLGWTQVLLTPVLAVFAAYAVLRRARGETDVSWTALVWMAGGVAAGLLPLARETVTLAGEAQVHMIPRPVTLGEFLQGTQLPLLTALAGSSWLVARVARWGRVVGGSARHGSAFLIGAWWLWQPVLLWSLATLAGMRVFLPRYFATAAVGTVLAGAWVVAAWTPAPYLRRAGAVCGAAILGMALWKAPPSREEGWREAAELASEWRGGAALTLCPSGFVEAQPPVWTPEYSLPGFLYAPLDVYPVAGECVLLPTREARQPVELVEPRVQEAAARGERIVVYGGSAAVGFWVEWLDARPELSGWRREVRMFGSVAVARYYR